MEKLACKICKKTTNNPVELGDKIIHKEMAVHYFCLVSSFEMNNKIFFVDVFHMKFIYLFFPTISATQFKLNASRSG